MSTRKNALIKPPVLKAGDQVAAISLSWGGASVYPHRYQVGKRQLEEAFGVKVVETPNALLPSSELSASPRLRAEDFMWAFENPDIKAIITIIGGDDSVRTLRYLDYDVIAQNPKIFMGYSDATASHFACMKAGISSIYGPTFMAGFAENAGIFDYMRQSVQKTLFSSSPIGEVKENRQGWTCDESLKWSDPESQKIPRPLNPSKGVSILQGTALAKGHLMGGCVEVLEMLKGTDVWPATEEWAGAILFLETSEEAPDPGYFMRCLRNYAETGILEHLSGIIMGRPANVSLDKLDQYDQALLHVVEKEYGLTFPIIGQMDFGHTDPMFLIPYGAQAEIDPVNKTFTILEGATQD